MHSRMSCSCFIFLHCVFSNAAWNGLHYMKYYHKCCIITRWNGFSPECGVVVFYVLSQNIVKYLPHQIQLKCVETVFLLNVAWCIFKCALRFPTKQHWMQSHTGCISLEWRTTLSLLRWPRQACDFSKLVLFPHISQEFLLLPFSSGWDASQVSEKQKQRCPSRSRFGADCSGISGSPCYHCNFGFIFPGQLKYHMKRVATKEKVVGLFMSCLVRAWRCRALMWVFISIQIWSCNYIFTKWCNYIFTRWYRMKCNTKGKSCTTWQDMFGHRLPQNRGPKMLIFSFCWRKLVHHLWTAVPNWIKTDRQTRQACLNPQKRFSFF